MKLAFDLLYDVGNKVAEAYGIVLATGGAVLGIEADPDYTRRPEPEETLAVLRPPA